MSDHRTLRRLVSYLRPYRGATILSYLSTLGSSAVVVLTPLITKQVIDNVIVAHRQRLTPWLILLVGAGLWRYLSGVVRRYYATRMSAGVELGLRVDLFESVQRLDGPQQDRVKIGQLVSRSVSDVGSVEQTIGNLPLVVANVIMLAVSIAVMFWLAPLLAVLVLLMTAAYLAAAARANTRVFPTFGDYAHHAGNLAAVVEAAVSGVRVVKGFGQERGEQQKLENAADTLFAAGMRRTRLIAKHFPRIAAIPPLGQAAILALGGWLAIHGSITLGTFVAFSTYLASMAASFNVINYWLVFAQQARAAAVRVFEVIDARPTLVDRPGAAAAPAGRVSIELSDVTFGYGESDPVLRNVNLRVDPGETVALVGGTGSGKSTIAMLLARFYDPRRGSVRLGGRDVRELSIGSVRAKLGMVFEDSFLIADSIRANIAFGRPGATDDDIRAAARDAEADDFIRSLPDGYDTVVGERGLTLSGGQRQRIALARALLTDPDVLILDDATSAVDAGVEAQINATLRHVLRGRAGLIIAHRHSTLRLADRIAVLRDGRIVDSGTHDELMERCPIYRSLLTGRSDDTEDRPMGRLTAALWTNPAPGADAGIFGTGGPVSEQAKLISALPPATDVPGIDIESARKPDTEFRLRRLWWPFRYALAAISVLLVLQSVAALVTPWLTRFAVDHGISRNSTNVLLGTCAGVLAVVLATWAIQALQSRITGNTGERMLYWLRIKMCAQLQRLGLDYYERERGGQIMTRMTTDIDSLAAFVKVGLSQLVIAVLTFAGVLAVMAGLDFGLTLEVLLLIPPLLAASWLYRRFSNQAYDTARERLSDVNTHFQESISGVRVSQAYGRESRNISTYRTLATTYYRAQTRAEIYPALLISFFEFTQEISIAIILGAGSARVTGGSLSTGTIVAFLLYAGMLLSPVQQLSELLDGYQRARVGLVRIRELLQERTSIPEPADPVRPAAVTGQLRFDSVCFRYNAAGPAVLSDIDLTIRPGETVAIVGETGAGKSTLLKLIPRFYDPTSGSIHLDNTDLRGLALHDYRQQLGIVPQESYLFSGLVRDVIGYARPEATDSEIEQAARAVGAHDMIARLPHGYLHPVGERGDSLSAGQRQLLALARAQLVDPAILLLDEATASLDLATEAAISRGAARLARDRTTVVIAHRLTTAQRADRIIVIAGGRIIETGTHDQLLRCEGRYAQLWSTFTGARTTIA